MKKSILTTVIYLLIGPLLFGQYDKLLKKHFTKEELTLANTAKNENYLSADEKEVIQVLNLARVYPKSFASFYLNFLEFHQNISYSVFNEGLKSFKRKDRYYYSLYKELLQLEDKELELLQPCTSMYAYAECWSKEMGMRNVTGHNRKKCTDGSFGECCSYMNTTNAVEHVLLLLIDEDIKSLGHRNTMFSAVISVGVSFAPHKEYGKGLVLDFTHEHPVNNNLQLVTN